jgi:hypothetical protein
LEQWIFNKNDFFRDRDTMVDLKSLQNNIDIMSKIGVIKSRRKQVRRSQCGW